jgi:4-pyridoxate dehydrogenase
LHRTALSKPVLGAEATCGNAFPRRLHRSSELDTAPYLAPFKKSYEDGFAIRAALLRPQSRGHVRLKSADPLKAPAIIQNFLATERDWQILRASIRMAEEVGHQGALRPFVGKKLAPLARTDADLNAYIMQSPLICRKAWP